MDFFSFNLFVDKVISFDYARLSRQNSFWQGKLSLFIAHQRLKLHWYSVHVLSLPQPLSLISIIYLRFAEFIEGSPHLTEGEVMEYSHWESFTDDESREEEDNGADIYTDDEEADAASDENRDF